MIVRSDQTGPKAGITPPPRISLGRFFRLNTDERKREAILLQVTQRVGGDRLHVVMMGEGWDNVASKLIDEGCTVDHISDFDAERYEPFIREVDYAIGFGTNEGAMFFLDARSVGTLVIVPFIGYHADLPHLLVTYAEEPDEIASVLRAESRLRSTAHELAEHGGWDDYAKAHMQLWGLPVPPTPTET